MSKIYNYMMTTAGLIFLLQIAGIPNGLDYVAGLLGMSDISNFAASDYYGKVTTIFSLGLVGTVIAGFFTSGKTESAIVAVICGFLLTLISTTYVAIITNSSILWVKYIVSAIFIPWMIAFGVALISWWRGSGG